ncbi:keratin, type I cytoskeletal 10-like [Euwallacea fornicatus]|uniref:keratin, type I cytoskeletal 10-like n=1 Tax=Euwallacea fornicatus TaxID=995702 RepID=UPI00338EE155
MKPFPVAVFTICIISAFANDGVNTYTGSLREVLNLYVECSHSEGLSPCLKMKALDLIDRVSRMQKIFLMDGVVINGQTEEVPNAPTLEEEEKNLPRALDAKNQALSSMLFTKIARMIGSKTIEVSLPKLIESARGKHQDDKFEELNGLFDKFGGDEGGHGGGGHGGGGGGHGGGGKHGGKKKKGGYDLKDFFMQLMAQKLAMLPLFIGGLFILAVKALTQAKIALLIAGIIFGKKLLTNKNQGHVEHVHSSSGWNGGSGGAGGWAGGWGGGAGGGGWEGGWDKRSLDEAHSLAYQGQKQEATVSP